MNCCNIFVLVYFGFYFYVDEYFIWLENRGEPVKCAVIFKGCLLSWRFIVIRNVRIFD